MINKTARSQTDDPVCPHCGTAQLDWIHALKDTDEAQSMECSSCDKPFTVLVFRNYSFDTTIPKCTVEHDWAEPQRIDFPMELLERWHRENPQVHNKPTKARSMWKWQCKHCDADKYRHVAFEAPCGAPEEARE